MGRNVTLMRRYTVAHCARLLEEQQQHPRRTKRAARVQSASKISSVFPPSIYIPPPLPALPLPSPPPPEPSDGPTNLLIVTSAAGNVIKIPFSDEPGPSLSRVRDVVASCLVGVQKATRSTRSEKSVGGERKGEVSSRRCKGSD